MGLHMACVSVERCLLRLQSQQPGPTSGTQPGCHGEEGAVTAAPPEAWPLRPRLSDWRADAWSLQMIQRALVSSASRLDRDPAFSPVAELAGGEATPEPVAAFHMHRWCPLAREGAAEACATLTRTRGWWRAAPLPSRTSERSRAPPKCWLSLSWSLEAPQWPGKPELSCFLPPFLCSPGDLRPPPPATPLRARGEPQEACRGRAPFVGAVLLCCVLFLSHRAGLS